MKYVNFHVMNFIILLISMAGGAAEHTVKAGDSVNSIAVTFSVSNRVVSNALLFPCYQFTTNCSPITNFTAPLLETWLSSAARGPRRVASDGAFSGSTVIYIPGALFSTIPPALYHRDCLLSLHDFHFRNCGGG